MSEPRIPVNGDVFAYDMANLDSVLGGLYGLYWHKVIDGKEYGESLKPFPYENVTDCIGVSIFGRKALFPPTKGAQKAIATLQTAANRCF